MVHSSKLIFIYATSNIHPGNLLKLPMTPTALPNFPPIWACITLETLLVILDAILRPLLITLPTPGMALAM